MIKEPDGVNKYIFFHGSDICKFNINNNKYIKIFKPNIYIG